MEGFGKRLIKARTEKGLTQKAFAELLEISPTRLNYWEKDKREPDLLMFNKIVNVLGIDANELLGLKLVENSVSAKKYNSLNASGKQKADEYISDLSEQTKYTAGSGSIAEDIAGELKQESCINSPITSTK